MKSFFKSLSRTDTILLCIIATLLLIILTGTITGLILKRQNNRSQISDPEPTAREIENLNKKLDDKIAAYTGLGTIRCITAPVAEGEEITDAGTAVVITPWLAYPEGDTIFYEEMARKRILITGIFTNYFSLRTKNTLLSTPEEKLKQEILDEINNQMSLGKISSIYFTDYIFLE